MRYANFRAQEAGFSKFHFHRIFQKYVGKSVAEFIRLRRLSSSAQLLLYSDERILDIALHYGFESQEAFTRALRDFIDSRKRGIYEKRMRFAGFVRTEEVSGWCGLWMRIDDKLQNMLGFDNMQYRSIKGTTDWNYYACVLDIPAEANCLNIGIILSGAGKAWLDDCTFEEVGMDIPVTDTDLPMERRI
ncbi:helix-turn-helix transcriptional regulator [Paenibacillus sp. BAC0078]